MITRNRGMIFEDGPGAPKKGIALLSGLLRCRRCGRKLTVRYTGRDRCAVRYLCWRGFQDTGDPKCISLSGTAIDGAVAAEIRRVVEPAAIEAARCAEAHSHDRNEDVCKAIELDHQAARFEAERAFRQFNAVDPANRLVADELERRWNHALARVREVETRLLEANARATAHRASVREVPESIAVDLATVWNDPSSSSSIRKRIVRTVIEEIAIDVHRENGEMSLVLHWRGGIHTELRVPCRKHGANRLHTNVQTAEAIEQLVTICSDSATAAYLTRNGHLTGHGHRWTAAHVKSFRAYRGIPPFAREKRASEGWLTLTEASKHLNLSASALRAAVERGRIPGKHPLPDGPWIFQRAALNELQITKIADEIRGSQRRSTASESNQLSLY